LITKIFFSNIPIFPFLSKKSHVSEANLFSTFDDRNIFMKSLSVAVITLNEEKNIRRCLSSIAHLADEIVVIDSYSTDQTEAICSEFGAQFEKRDFEGYIQQKNYALSRCKNDFVLSLDADEVISEELALSIYEEKKKGFPSGTYNMNRLTNYCGQWIRHCGWYPDVKLRLFDKQLGSWGGTNPHDKFILKNNTSEVSHLNGDILHYSYYTIEEHYEQANHFADVAAKALHLNGKHSSLLLAAVKTIAKFLRNYIIKAGFLEGRNGFTICKISALETWWKYTRLIRLNTKNLVNDKD
jgi:glycosyltransferase involved in cell wall biosynthesis